MSPVKLIDIFCFRTRVIKTERYNKTKKGYEKKFDKRFPQAFLEVHQILSGADSQKVSIKQGGPPI